MMDIYTKILIQENIVNIKYRIKDKFNYSKHSDTFSQYKKISFLWYKKKIIQAHMTIMCSVIGS